MVSANKLAFPIVSDVGGKTIREYGLLHAGAGPKGTDISMPAQVLIAPDGRILWRHQSPRVQDRVRPEDVLAAIAAAR